jgi:hypothetical protein
LADLGVACLFRLTGADDDIRLEEHRAQLLDECGLEATGLDTSDRAFPST